MTLAAADLPLDELLRETGRQGGFHFSYNSDVLPEDSLVTLSVRNKTVREVLDSVFKRKLEYIESGNYIILRRPGRGLALTLQDIRERGSTYLVSGRVTDLQTGRGVPDASVYEKQLLLATLTDTSGRFLLRVRDRYRTVALTASKVLYEDTTMFIQLEGVTVLPGRRHGRGREGRRRGNANPDGENTEVERTGLGRFLVSSRQRIQSLNLREFFTESPVQASLTPGLSSQGRMSAQVVNKVSVNFIGGYTAGVDGIEMAGVFNMNKKSVEHVQLAGAFNIVGGSVRGVQAAGAHNMVLDSVRGVQLAGAYNRVKGSVSGVQAAGGAGIVGGDLTGLQLSGAINRTRGFVKGLQLSGGINYAGYLRGVQVGAVNIADSSAGYSLGLVNIIRKNGYLRISLFTNESFRTNLAFKSGTSKLYAILQGGMTPGPQKLYACGAGLGKEVPLKHGLSLQPEFIFQEVYQGNSSFNNHLYRLNIQLNYRFGKAFHVFAGPSFNAWNSDQETQVEGYGFIPSARRGNFGIGSGRLRGWIGWSAGLTWSPRIFSSP